MDEASRPGRFGPREDTTTSLKMPASSRYGGQLIDASSRRSVRIIPDGKRDPIAAASGRVTVDYFYHGLKYWRASIPIDGIEAVYGQAFNFSKPKVRRTKCGDEMAWDKYGSPKRTIPVLYHLQCRLRFRAETPIELTPLDVPGAEGHVSAEPVRIHDAVYSLEASGPIGVSFNMRDAMAGNLISTHRLMSTEAMVFERMVVENQFVSESPPLPLTDAQKRHLVAEAIRRSDHAGMDETYFLYRPFRTNNCTSGPFGILDQVVDYRFFQRVGSMLYRLPLSPRFYLRVRGMDADPSYRKLLAHEFDSFVNDPRTQRLKKEYVRRRNARKRAQKGGGKA